MSHCWAGTYISDLESKMEREFCAVSARQSKLEADVQALSDKLDQVLALLGPQTVPKRDLRKPSQGNSP